MSRSEVVERMHQRRMQSLADEADRQQVRTAGRVVWKFAAGPAIKISLVLGVAVVVVMAVSKNPSAHAAGMNVITGHAAPNVLLMPNCTCPPKHAPYVPTGRVINGHMVTTSTSAKGHRELRIWEWIPARQTKGGHFYPAHWECIHHKDGTVTYKFKPAHTTKPTFTPGHFGWVYKVI